MKRVFSLTDLGNGYFIPTYMVRTEEGVDIYQFNYAYYKWDKASDVLKMLSSNLVNPDDWHVMAW